MTKALQGEWLAFPQFVSEDVARQVFVKRFGHEPAQVHKRSNLLLVGPINQRLEQKGEERDA